MAINDLISNIKSHISEAPGPEDVHIPDDLSELDDVLPPDPPPARRTKGSKTAKPAPAKVTVGTKRQITDAVKILLLFPAGAWALRDEKCGGTALSIVDNVTAAAVPIIARNPAAVAFFTEGTAWLEWLALFSALSPLARDVWSHHIVGRDEDEDSEPEVTDYAQYAAPSLV